MPAWAVHRPRRHRCSDPLRSRNSRRLAVESRRAGGGLADRLEIPGRKVLGHTLDGGRHLRVAIGVDDQYPHSFSPSIGFYL